MPIVVDADRVRIGSAQFLPRCDSADPMNKVVAAGETWTVPVGNSIWTCIEVGSGGTLRVSRTDDTTLRVQTFYVLPGGVSDIGTQADPIPADRKVEIVILDVPINTTDSTKRNYDPFTWGNGVINFGKQTRVGAMKTPFVVMADAQAGQNFLMLASLPQGWRVGDELLLPDTRKPLTELTRPRREATVTIAAINGQMVTLSKPLDFAHLTDLTADGKVAVRPIVANLTRNIVIRSESITGTPGHSANVGDGATWDLSANQLVGLGRTTTDVLNSTPPDLSHIGTNEVGRYASHNHHAGHGTLGSQDVDNVYIAGRGKWAHSQHGTHDMLFKDNIAVGFKGAGFVTEDGYEVRNKFYGNLAAYIIPDSLDTPFSSQNVTDGRPGVEGAGGWFRSVMNDFQGNQFWNNVDGMNLFAQQQVAGFYPSVPGGPTDTLPHPREQPSVAIQRNNSIANMLHGLDVWGVITPVEDLVSVNTAGVSVEISQSNATQIPVYIRPLISTHAFDSEDARYPVAIGANNGYVPTLDFRDGYIGGHAKAVFDGGAITYVRFTNMVLQNAIDVDFSSRTTREYTETNVLHKPLAPHKPQYVIFGSGFVWQPGGAPPPDGFIDGWLPAIGNRYTVKNWQGSGKDYRLFELQQRTSTPAWPSSLDSNYRCPEVGITMGDCFARFGIGFRGDVVAPAEEVPLEGLINAVGALGLKTTFGPPRAVLTFPLSNQQAPVTNGNIAAAGVLTGDPAPAGVSPETMRVSVDGAATFDLNQRDGFRQTYRPFNLPAGANGQHEIRTWRTTTSGETIPSSLLTFHYTVGTIPPPPQTTTVPNVVGQTQAAATTALTGAQLVVGPVTTASSTTVPAGSVISSNPAAGATVNIGSAVALVVSSGPQTTTVPNVVGQPQTAAASAILGAGLMVGTVTPQADPAPSGQVLTQAPPAGTAVALGSAVNLIVSAGPPPVPTLTLPLEVTICDSSAPPNCQVYVPKKP